MEQLCETVRGYVQLDDKLVKILHEGGLVPPLAVLDEYKKIM